VPPGKRGFSPGRRGEALPSVSDPFARRSLRVAYHIRRYSVIYVVGALAAIAVGLLPTVGGGKSATLSTGAGASTGGAYGNSAPSPSTGGAAAPGGLPTGGAGA